MPQHERTLGNGEKRNKPVQKNKHGGCQGKGDKELCLHGQFQLKKMTKF